MSRPRPKPRGKPAGQGTTPRGRTEPPTLPAEDHVRHLVQLAARPEALEALDPDALLLIAFQLALYFGVVHEPEVGEALAATYDRLVAHVTVDERLELLDRITEAVHARSTTVLAMLPFVRQEPDPRIVQAAATSFASLVPLSGDDPMTGPRTVRAMLDHAEDEPVRAGLLAGLLALGDRRTLSVLRGSWRALGVEGRVLLTRAPFSFASACLVEFWLDWLEDADTASAEKVAAALARLPSEGGGKVLDLLRKFPENGPGDEPEIAVIGEWTVAEYGLRLAPRLADLAQREGDPALLDGVFEAWGLAGSRAAPGDLSDSKEDA